MKEYGGYIEFEYFHGTEYHENAIALNSGRHCVEYLIRKKHIKKMLLPYFMCNTVRMICEKCGVEISYYHISNQFKPLYEGKLEKDEWLYLVNYYGQLPNSHIYNLKKKYNNIIIDNVQAFFQMPVIGVDTLYSCRKFFGVADGGYLYTDEFVSDKMETDISYERMVFLLGRMERGANEFYNLYVENNNMFEFEPMKSMSRLTCNLMKGIDYQNIKNVRTENFAYMHRELGKINKLNLVVPDGAFMYPLYIGNGTEIRKHLQRDKIYVPILWPDVFDVCSEGELEYDMAKNILPLPVDQRYTIKDMEYLVGEVMKERIPV